MRSYDLIIIGAGVSGMTCAISATNKGIKNILLLEGEEYIGGIMNILIHNGFGEKILGKPVTGPEYVDYLEDSIDKNNVEILLKTMVLDVDENKCVTYVNEKDGVKKVKGTAIVFATGAKERYFGETVLITKKLVGIQTLGEVHKMINLEGYLPGKDNVILAKNIWAFIVARRIKIEGGNVKGIIIEQSFDSLRGVEIDNILDGFDIPIYDNCKIVRVNGKDRIQSVIIQKIDDNTQKEISCDELVLSVNFESNNTLAKKKKIEMPYLNDVLTLNKYNTSKEGFFACGNVIYGEKLFETKNINGIECGNQAAAYIKSMYMQ